MGVNIPTGYAQISFAGLVAADSEEVVMTLGVQLTSGLVTGMAEAARAAWSDALDSVTSTDFTFAATYIKAGPNDTGPTQESTGAVETGSVAVAMVPLNTALLVRKSTALGGRQGRGRMYSCGQAMVDNCGGAGLLDAGAVESCDAAFFALLGAIQGITGIEEAVLLHSDALTPTPITALSPQARLATQRRRLRP
jgi:hypothetical protein